MNTALRLAPVTRIPTRPTPWTRLCCLVGLFAVALLPAQQEPGGPGNPLQEARDAMRKRLLDNELWYGEVRLVIQGAGEATTGAERRSFSIQREVVLTFRLPMMQGELQAITALERAAKMSPSAAKMIGPQLEKLRVTRHWLSEVTNRKPEDADQVSLVVRDRAASSGTEPCSIPPETYDDRHSCEGTRSEQAASAHLLSIDLEKGTYTLAIDGRSDLLTLTTITTHTGKPEQRTVAPGSASGNHLTIGEQPLPATGRVLTGRKTMARQELQSLVPFGGMTFGTLQGLLTWTLSPEPLADVELVVQLAGYPDWLPRGGKDETTAGNHLPGKVVLRRRGGGETTARIDALTLRLDAVSREPGVCLNQPLGGGATSPDLQFAADSGATLDQQNTRLQKQGLKAAQYAFTIDCYDWAASAKFVAEATLADGRQVFATLDGDPTTADVRLPKRSESSLIADAWQTLMGGAARDTDDDDRQAGNGNRGDGLTRFEEYRGMLAKGKHTRDHAAGPDGKRPLMPGTKDLVVENTIQHALLPSVKAGLRLFEQASGIHIVEVDAGEFDPARQVNLNLGSATAGPQHGLRLVNASTIGSGAVGQSQGVRQRVGSASLGGSPAGWEKITVDLDGERQVYADLVRACTAQRLPVPFTLDREVQSTVAHELAHGLGVLHHGDSRPVKLASNTIDATTNRSLLAYDRDGTVITQRPFQIGGAIGEAGNDASGDVHCLMCYNNVWTWSYFAGEAVYAAPILDVGDVFCRSNQATGPNAPRLLANGKTVRGVFGAATAGNCLGRMRVKDQ